MNEEDGKPGGSIFSFDQCNQCPGRKSSAAAAFANLTVEMIELDQSSKEYTSFKNLLRTASMLSPVGRNSSWEDIPLKDPIVKQAAWAYLQPMTPSAGEDYPGGGIFGIFRRAKDNKSRFSSHQGECGCLAWLNEVVVKGVLQLLSGKKRMEFLPEEEKENTVGRGYCGDGEKAD
ncbi:unnamed protein product [Linum trigynum]